MKSWRAELHCHTHRSHDGMITPGGLLAAARAARLDAVAITDHDTVEGALEFRRWFQRRDAGIEILIGEERTLDNQCHLIGLFLKEAIRSTSFTEAVEEIHAQGGLALAPHPLRKDGLLGTRAQPPVDAGVLDGLEIHNAKGSFEDNQRTRADLAHGPAGVFGGSDAHYEADVGQCVNVIDWQGSAEATVRAMLGRAAAFSILARPQRPGGGERQYAPVYHAMKKYVRVPRALLPLAKQLYRLYWNLRPNAGGAELAPVHQFDHDSAAALTTAA